MDFFRIHKKSISIIFIILSFAFLMVFFLMSICIYANIKEKPAIDPAFFKDDKEIILGNSRRLIKTSKINDASKAIKQVDNKAVSNGITRKSYKDGMMVIGIPKIKVRAAVIDGTSKKALKRGPGLYENSLLPSEKVANVCIAAHRNAYGEWFRHIDKLKRGDEIYLEFNKIKYIYEVAEVYIVEKNDWSVTWSTGYDAITLTSCHPLKPPYKRIVARGKLKEKIKIKD